MLSGFSFGGKVIDNSDSLNLISLAKDTDYEGDFSSVSSRLSIKLVGYSSVSLKHFLIGFFLF